MSRINRLRSSHPTTDYVDLDRQSEFSMAAQFKEGQSPNTEKAQAKVELKWLRERYLKRTNEQDDTIYQDSLKLLRVMQGFEMFSENSLAHKDAKSRPASLQPVSDGGRREAHGFLRRVDMIAGEYNNANYLQDNFYDNVVANPNFQTNTV